MFKCIASDRFITPKVATLPYARRKAVASSTNTGQSTTGERNAPCNYSPAHLPIFLQEKTNEKEERGMQRSSIACAGLRRSLLSRDPLFTRPSFRAEYVFSLAAPPYSKFEPHQIGFASLYHTSTPTYARVAVAEVLDVESVQPTEKASFTSSTLNF